MKNLGKGEGENGIHKPVLLEEVCRAFGLVAPLNNQAQKKKSLIVDATLGSGGHAKELINRGAYIIGIDADRRMVEIASDSLKKLFCPSGGCEKYFTVVNDNFVHIKYILANLSIQSVDGVLLDLGISSYHYMFSRGFSFNERGSQLDMRISDDYGVSASDLLNALPKTKLNYLFEKVMPYPDARKVVRAVVEKRSLRKIQTVADFTDILDKIHFGRSGKRISDYTLPFMALRIAVNSELENLRDALRSSYDVLKKDGVLAVISFHSGEDRIVKNLFKEISSRDEGIICADVIVPDISEILKNPKARSAKLRVIKKNYEKIII